jgi:hypothetical protein
VYSLVPLLPCILLFLFFPCRLDAGPWPNFHGVIRQSTFIDVRRQGKLFHVSSRPFRKRRTARGAERKQKARSTRMVMGLLSTSIALFVHPQLFCLICWMTTFPERNCKDARNEAVVRYYE